MKNKKVNIKNVKPDDIETKKPEKTKNESEKNSKMSMEKRERINKTLDELKAFLIIALIIFIAAFSGWYWYTNFYNENKNENKPLEEKEVENYKISKYIAPENRLLKLINEKYLIEYKDDILYKIMDLKNKVLFEGEELFSNIYEGIDDSLYLVINEEENSTNVIYLSKLEDEKFVEVKNLSEGLAYYAPIKYYENEYSNSFKVLGFTAVKSAYDEDMREINKSYIYLLGNEEFELNDYFLYGDSIHLKEGAREVITYDKKYIVISEINSSSKKYGLYDLENKKVVIKPQYEGLYRNKNEEYIVIKDGKYGIIDKSLKKIVNYEYEFIDKNDDYYVVSKDKKLAIMDKNYKLITKFEFDYQEIPNIKYNYLNKGDNYNTFSSAKINDKYILVINNKEYIDDLEYEKHEAYFINADGTYETIIENDFYINKEDNFFYSYNKEDGIYTFYDQDLKEKFKINISDYDYDLKAQISLKNNNTINIKLDSDIYFDANTGEEIKSVSDEEMEINGIKIQFSGSNNEYKYLKKGTENRTMQNMIIYIV